VYSYFRLASIFHVLIAARPLWLQPSSWTVASAAKHVARASASRPLSDSKKISIGLGVIRQEVVHPGFRWKAGGCQANTSPTKEARMNIHQNARTTPASRAALVRRVLQAREPVRHVATGVGVSVRTVRKWVHRFRGEGLPGLHDRSSRPHHSPRATAPAVGARIVALRRHRWTGAQIAAVVCVSEATVARQLRHQGLARLQALEPIRAVQRYERAHPGELLHVDTQSLERIGRVGHRITGDRRARSRGIGWEYAHVCVDDASRLAYAEILPMSIRGRRVGNAIPASGAGSSNNQ
jgi:transposase